MGGINAIDEERRRLNLSQKTLCAEARIAPSTYVRLKRGKVGAMELTLVKLRNALAVIAQRQDRA